MSRSSTCVIAVAVAVVTSVRGEEPLARFLESLHSRRLDGLLEVYFERELESGFLAEDRQILLGAEYASLLATRAASSTRADRRQELWKKSRDVLTETLFVTTDPSVRFGVRFQLGSLEYLQGEWYRQWGELGPPGAADFTTAIEHSQQAARQLQKLIEEIEESLRPPARSSSSVSERERTERLRILAVAVRSRLGSALLSLARARRPNDPEIPKILESAIEQLELVVQKNVVDETSHQPFLDLLTALRLIGDFEKSKKLLDRRRAVEQDPERLDSLFAERVESMLAQGHPLDALELLHPAIDQREEPPPRWVYQYLKILLVQSKAMRQDEEAASKLQASALGRLQQLRTRQADYWVHRAELFFADFATTIVGGDLQRLRQMAEILSRLGRQRQAAEMYRRAVAELAGSGRKAGEDAFELCREAARAWERAEFFGNASQDYEAAVRNRPNHPEAAEALLRAIVCTYRIHRQSRSAEHYRKLNALLDWHLESYPGNETSAEVSFLIGSLRKAEQKYVEAIEHFAKILPEHRLRKTGLLEIGRCYEDWLGPPADNLSLETVGLQQAVEFHKRLLGERTDSIGFDLFERAEISIRCATFLLDARISDPMEAKTLLDWIPRSRTLPRELADRARRYLILASLLLDENHEAMQAARQQATASVEELLESSRLLNQLAQTRSELSRKSIGRVQRIFIDGLEGRELDIPTEMLFELQLARARAELNLGDAQSVEMAIGRIENLLLQNPRDARLLEAAALAEMRLERFESAISKWRTLISGLEQGTRMWFRAKLNLARSLRRLDRHQQARQIIDLLGILHPQLGGPSLKRLFEEEKRRLARVPVP